MAEITPVKGGARLSPDGAYRYELTREWTEYGRYITWIMLNPSTADADRDDPTIRRCITFSRRWGYGALRVVNLFAFRATDPRALLGVEDPVGEENDESIKQAVGASYRTICAWGSNPAARERAEEVRRLLCFSKLYCLGRTMYGAPRHPLYVRGDQRPEGYR